MTVLHIYALTIWRPTFQITRLIPTIVGLAIVQKCWSGVFKCPVRANIKLLCSNIAIQSLSLNI